MKETIIETIQKILNIEVTDYYSDHDKDLYEIEPKSAISINQFKKLYDIIKKYKNIKDIRILPKSFDYLVLIIEYN